ncbi:hypothetical protein DVV91_11930 [Clostridium botulinum]|nr:hypothetical protein [Clostridium botulinum]MBN1075050.1 hypothetical protein [Clostridium botulinum]MBN1078329.1 hypothetical protein [Clostridium botulinum]
MSGNNKVVVQKNKSSYISLEGECYNQSNAVYENGSCMETYEPFTDDDEFILGKAYPTYIIF